MLLSGLPPLVREGDRFRATFTVRNASRAAAATSRSPRACAGRRRRDCRRSPPQQVDLAPGEAREIALGRRRCRAARRRGSTGRSTRPDERRRDAERDRRARRAEDHAEGRRRRCRSARTRRRSCSSTQPQSIAVQRPADAIPGRGGVNVRMQAKLAGELPGVRDYLRALSVHLLRAAGVDRDRPARRGALGRADARAARLSRPRRPGQVLAAAARRQRHADRVRAVDRRRSRLGDSRRLARNAWSRR